MTVHEMLLCWALGLAIVVTMGAIHALRKAEARLRRSWMDNDDLRVEAQTLRLSLDLTKAKLPTYGRDPKTGRYKKVRA